MEGFTLDDCDEEWWQKGSVKAERCRKVSYLPSDTLKTDERVGIPTVCLAKYYRPMH